jgi:Uri superfamily endonuclease
VATDALTGPGTYALLIALDRARSIAIGRRGKFCFPAGLYLYVGSALGPGGLRGRLTHHLGVEKRLHWHIDYLLRATHSQITEVWTMKGATRRECDWANAAMHLMGAGMIAPRFGASDCRCATHLVHFAKPPSTSAFAALVGAPVQRWVIE